MSMYYADWSWIYRLTTAAGFVISGIVLAVALVNGVRTRLEERHERETFVASVAPSREITVASGGAVHHWNGRRAA